MRIGVMVVTFLLGLFSFVRLAEQGFAFGFGPIFSEAIHWYEANLGKLLSPFGSVVEGVLRVIGANFHVEFPPLAAYWKHIFVLMFVYFGARASSAFNVGNWGAGLLLIVSGFASALVTSVVAGVIPTNSHASVGIALMAGAPAVGAFLVDLAENVWSATVRRKVLSIREGDPSLSAFSLFLRLSTKASLRFLVAAMLVVVGMFAADRLSSTIPNPGLALLLILTFLMGGYWMIQGIGAVEQRRAEFPGKSWFAVYRDIGSSRVGLSIMRYVVVGLLAVAIGVYFKL